MENTSTTTPSFTEHAYDQAAHFLITQKMKPAEAISALMDTGVSGIDAKHVVERLHEQVTTLKREKANKDMLYGGLWCVGGSVATLPDIGFIFWGAIVFGGIQLVRGVISYASLDN